YQVSCEVVCLAIVGLLIFWRPRPPAKVGTGQSRPELFAPRTQPKTAARSPREGRSRTPDETFEWWSHEGTAKRLMLAVARRPLRWASMRVAPIRGRGRRPLPRSFVLSGRTTATTHGESRFAL